MDLFDKIRVLGQVDKKFIAVTAKSLNTSSDITGHDILLLFDQHAVHERIRLENLIRGELIVSVLDKGLGTPPEKTTSPVLVPTK